MTRVFSQSWQPAVWFLVGIVCAFAPPAAAQTKTSGLLEARPAEAGMDAQQLAKIPQRMQQVVEQKQGSGVVTLVVKQGKIVHLEAVGLADVDAKRPMYKDSLFAIASMTKPITATAVMILKDEGKLALDDKISKYVPAFAEAKLKEGGKLEREITLRDVLTHTSGLGGSQQNEGTLANTVEQLASRPLDFQPGTKWQYSPGISVAGRVVEVASGKPFDAFLAERIFQPLGMKDTSFLPTPEQQKRLARLYQPNQDKTALETAKHWINDLSGERTPNPSGGLFSTASDMARFYQMVLNGGELDGKRIVSKAAVEEMTRIQTGDLVTGFTPGNGWGLGWCVLREPQGVSRMLSSGTFGHGGAFGTQGWVDPKRQMIFVLLIQRTNFGNSDGSDIREAFQDLVVKALRE